MNREITYLIEDIHAGQSVRDFLQGKGYSRQNLIALKKYEDGILVGGTPRYMNYLLCERDVLTVRIHDEDCSEKIPPVELPLDIVYEDADLLVVNKPAGMPIHPSLNNYDNSLANALVWYFEKQGKNYERYFT